MKKLIKKFIKGIGKVLPCRRCGSDPVWGAGFLICPKFCKGMESETNSKQGEAVRTWNKIQELGRSRYDKLVEKELSKFDGDKSTAHHATDTTIYR